jgi:hypothetical protein
MSTITTLNDWITANSFRTQTNTNFANLNTDKLEASDIVWKEDVANKSTSVTTDQASNTKYPSVKSVYDWATTTLSKYLGDADFYQYSIVRTVSGGNLTVALKNYEGNDPTPSVPVKIMIGVVVRTISSALSFTNGAWFNWWNSWSTELATKEIDWFCYFVWRSWENAVKLTASRYPSSTIYWDFSINALNEKWNLWNFGSPISTDEVVNIGRFNAILSAGAGYTWSIPATSDIRNYPIYSTRAMDSVPTFDDLGSMTVTDNNDVREYSRYIISNSTITFQFWIVVTAWWTLWQSMSLALPFSSKYVRITWIATLAPNLSWYLSSEDWNTKVYLRKYNSTNYNSWAQWITGSITYEI